MIHLQVNQSSLRASVNPRACVVGEEATDGFHKFWGNFFSEGLAWDVDVGADVGNFS